MEIDDNKVEKLSIMLKLVFYEDKNTDINTWGTNTVAYEIYYSCGIMSVFEIGAFGDSTLVARFNDRRNRGITLDEMLENIKELSQMTYKEFKEKVLEKGD